MKRLFDPERKERVVTFLNRKEVDYLDKLGKDALFSTGCKVSRAKIIAWLVDFIAHLKLDGEGITSEKDFQKRIKDELRSPSLATLGATQHTASNMAKGCHGRL